MQRIVIPLILCTVGTAVAVENVTVRRDGKEFQVTGREWVTAQDGGIVVLAPDGVLWAIPPEEQVKHTSDKTPFKPYSAEELGKRLLAELPDGFRVHQTAHYLVCFDTSPVYAQWCGSLFERLYMAFTNYWSRKGFTLSEPEFPLVAIVFADKRAYLKYSSAVLGSAGESIIGYFNLTTNQMVMYDLTGTESLGHRGRIGSSAQINQILSRPEALQTVATIVHEATHQIAFNCGLHTRLSDCPVWFSEGIAEYFETPDLASAKGWRGIGNVNRSRLEQFQRYLRSRPADSLESLLAQDKRFRDTSQSPDAYAEAWALTYFLVRQRSDRYIAYMTTLAEKRPLMAETPEKRLAEFQKAFGSLKTLDAEFLRYMIRAR